MSLETAYLVLSLIYIAVWAWGVPQLLHTYRRITELQDEIDRLKFVHHANLSTDLLRMDPEE